MTRDERTYAFAGNMTKLRGRARIPRRLLAEPAADGSLAAGTGNGPRGNFQFAGDATALNGGAQTPNFYNSYAAFLMGLVVAGPRACRTS